jgi:hypothetical protein|uniref:Uncharacterized protein n=1 Tax=Bacteriophage sp. TaxID=38018 RepID=A0A8D9PET2_9VIRU|nr:MAG TPA: hypothetical protein [Bacteriophage sp.]
MILLKIAMILFLVFLGGVLVWLLFGLLIGPLVFKGIFDADLDDINEKRKREECVKMGFDKWYDIYCLNTKKWSLGCLPSCRIDTTRPKFGDIIITSNYWNHSYCIKDVYVDFGFIGNLKYSLWRHKYLKSKETREANEREVKNLKLILESAQEDIEILKKQSEEEMKKAAETSTKVKENLDKELHWHHNNIKGKDIAALIKMKTEYDNDPPMVDF